MATDDLRKETYFQLLSEGAIEDDGSDDDGTSASDSEEDDTSEITEPQDEAKQNKNQGPLLVQLRPIKDGSDYAK